MKTIIFKETGVEATKNDFIAGLFVKKGKAEYKKGRPKTEEKELKEDFESKELKTEIKTKKKK
jgi:hypothetical protein